MAYFFGPPCGSWVHFVSSQLGFRWCAKSQYRGLLVVQVETEEEEIVLQPIGPGMQNLEPDGSGTLRARSLTPVFPPEQPGNENV